MDAKHDKGQDKASNGKGPLDILALQRNPDERHDEGDPESGAPTDKKKKRVGPLGHLHAPAHGTPGAGTGDEARPQLLGNAAVQHGHGLGVVGVLEEVHEHVGANGRHGVVRHRVVVVFVAQSLGGKRRLGLDGSNFAREYFELDDDSLNQPDPNVPAKGD